MIDYKEYAVQQLPHEFAIGGVYMPPLLVAGLLAVLRTFLTAYLLNRYRLSRYFFYPPLVSLSLSVIYTIFIGTYILGA